MSEFVHLQVKSHYSLRSGLPTPKDIVDAAHKNGLKAVAMTDKNSLFGIIKFYNYAISKGVKPICGVDFDIESNLKGLNKGLLLVNPPLGRALIEDALLRFLLKKDYELEAGSEYKFTISAKF